ncbi:MAG TPA: hypothetical protein VJ728_11270 [Candidatus Binataceae bacterium]|nr:hypothetical protein [Candidatus Binataceae bacterium]
MNTNGEVAQLEAELESDKQQLRNDTQLISHKLAVTRAQLSPTAIVERHLFLLSMVGFIVGFVLGYREVPVMEIAQPAARAMLGAAGKDVAMRAIRGR